MAITPELLAPAGSMASLRAATDNGANAVYFGIGLFNARANAENISIDTLKSAVSYCHLRGVRVYLALNILVSDEEIEEVLDIVSISVQENVDAVIVQDIGIAHLIREKWPEFPIHAGTQMNLYMKNAGEYAMNNGISRIVFPREISVDQLRERSFSADKYGVESEVFIHGALCVGYSGVCLFSAMNETGTRSGNRGNCAQPCRQSYQLVSRSNEMIKSGRILSLKDLCAVQQLKDLIGMNIHSLKIEGRMRDDVYTAASVFAYRRIIDAIVEDRCGNDLVDKMHRLLLLAYNRGGAFSSSYLKGVKSADIVSGEYTGKYGLFIGEIYSADSRSGEINIHLDSDVIPMRGDFLSIRNNHIEIASFPIGKVFSDETSVTVKGLHPEVMRNIVSGSKVYITGTKNIFALLGIEHAPRKTLVVWTVQKVPETIQTLRVSLCAHNVLGREFSAIKIFELPQNYGGGEISCQRIIDQLGKTGNSAFSVKETSVDSGLILKTPISYLNEIRRTMLALLEEEILKANFRTIYKHPLKHIESREKNISLHDFSLGPAPVAIDYLDLRYYHGRLAQKADIYIFSVYNAANVALFRQISALHDEEPNAKILLRVPSAYSDVLTDTIQMAIYHFEKTFPESYAGIISSYISHEDRFSFLSPFANIFNSYSLKEAQKLNPLGVSISYELSPNEYLKLVLKNSSMFLDKYLFVHHSGLIQWMVSEFCPLGTHVIGCKRCSNDNSFFLNRSRNTHGIDTSKNGAQVLICHPEGCTSEIWGPPKWILNDEHLKQIYESKIQTINLLRIYKESYEETANRVLQIRSQILQSFSVEK